MPSNSFKNSPKENLSSLRSPYESVDKGDRRDAKEISAAKELGKAAYVEAIGLDESVETTGKISEVLGESDEVKGDGASTGGVAQTAVSVAEIKANLLKNIPNERVMRRQIESEIKKEVKYLQRKAMKMISAPGSMSFFEMSNLVKKIRELRSILASLVKASLDSLKTLWLRFVHGVL